MNNPKLSIIQFKGFSKSGKTSIIEKLIKFLSKKNYNVAAIKNIHIEDFTIDTPGKNTWRFHQAGADPVISIAESESAFIVNQKLSLDSIIKIIEVIAKEKSINKLDKKHELSKEKLRNACPFIKDRAQISFLFIEGAMDPRFPIVLTAKNFEDLKDLFDLIDSNSESVKILQQLICISGAITTNYTFKEIKSNFKQLFNQYFPEVSTAIFENIKVLDGLNNPDFLMEIIEQSIIETS